MPHCLIDEGGRIVGRESRSQGGNPIPVELVLHVDDGVVKLSPQVAE